MTPEDQLTDHKQIIVHNDGHRPFSELSLEEQGKVKDCYIHHHGMSLRAVGRHFKLTYGSLVRIAHKEEWDGQRKLTLEEKSPSTASKYYDLSQTLRQRLRVIIYETLEDIMRVFRESARLAAQEGYTTNFDFDKFGDFVEFVSRVEHYFEKPEDLISAQGDNPSERVANYIQVNLSTEEKVKYSGALKMVLDSLAKNKWKTEAGDPNEVLEVESLPVIDPAKGQTR